MKRDTLTLKKDWGPHKAGAELGILAPGEDLVRGCIDQRRAAQLVADGFVVRPEPAASQKAAPKPAAPPQNKKKGK